MRNGRMDNNEGVCRHIIGGLRDSISPFSIQVLRTACPWVVSGQDRRSWSHLEWCPSALWQLVWAQILCLAFDCSRSPCRSLLGLPDACSRKKERTAILSFWKQCLASINLLWEPSSTLTRLSKLCRSPCTGRTTRGPEINLGQRSSQERLQNS